jgi:NAD+ kinase
VSAFGFLLHGERELAADLGAELGKWLIDRGHEVRFSEHDAERVAQPQWGYTPEELALGLDLLIGVGGDGTMLDAVALASPSEVPVLGINVGQLGYLTTVEPASATSALKRFLAGAFVIDERMRLASRIERTGGGVETAPSALNEALLERRELGHTVRLDVELDGEPFTPYVADGVILATPTGSTAYAFSARGPIVDPGLRAQVLVPVSPHMLFDRALVLAPDTAVRLVVSGTRPAHLSVDGHSCGTLEVGDAIVCSADPTPARLVRFGRPGVHHHLVLKAKFALPDR